MNADDASNAVRACLGAFGLASVGLNARGHGGAFIGTETVTFEHDAKNGALHCRVHVYQFRAAPPPGVVERLERFAREQPALTGGGALCLETGLLSLKRTYETMPTGSDLAADVRTLLVASVRFAERLLESHAAEPSAHSE